MLIILQNASIISIDKTLLQQLNADLSSVSQIIDNIKFQISSLTKESLQIGNFKYKVEEIEMLSISDIKVFNITIDNTQAVLNIDNNLSQTDYPSLPDTESLNTETALQTATAQTAEIPSLEIDNNEINYENKLDFHTDTINETLIQEKQPDESEKNIQIQLETKSTQPEIIEISFEDDLVETNETLSLSKEEFQNTIISELKKASKELGIGFEELTKWYNQLIQQIKDEKNEIYNSINSSDYTNLHKSYHKLKGAALNLRLSKIALILKKLDELSKNMENIEKIRKITNSFYTLIENEKINFTQNDKDIKQIHEDIILKTIQSYLKEQNEAQFQKDKKYIEKLLNTKINSLKDLQKIIKEIE